MTNSTRPGMPFANASVATFIDRQIDTLKGVKTQRQIAAEIGYDKPNMISMFKRGEVRVPLEKIPALAKAIEADPSHLFRLALEQYWPEMKQTIVDIFGRLATANEEELLLKPWREFSRHMDPALESPIRDALTRALREAASGERRVETAEDCEVASTMK